MKTNKKLTKTILLSSLAIAAFGSVAAGTTYALFTSKAESSITVTTGKVSVSQQVEIKERYTPALINEDGTIADKTNAYDETTGFEVTVTDNDVAVTKMLPGDKVTLTITPKNDSNVKIKYRETYAITGDENDVLEVTGESGMITHWTVLEAGGTIEAYEVSIEIPATATKGVEDAKITLGLEAVQSNAKVYDTEVSDAAGLEEALASTQSATSVKVNSDIELSSILNVKHDLTIYGADTSGETKTKITFAAGKDRVFNVDGDAGVNQIDENATITLVGIDIVGPKNISEGRGISIWGTKNCTLILDNCSASCSYYALNIAKNNENINVIVRNSTISGYMCFQTWSSGTKATFENCILNGENIYASGSSNSCYNININKGYTGCELTFNNCVFNMNSVSDNVQYILMNDTEGNKIYFNECEFYDDGVKISNVKNYLALDGIEGSVEVTNTDTETGVTTKTIY